MTRAEIIKEIKILQELEKRKPVWTPQKTNEPQKAAFECTADEIGYGGAAGGGKTWLGKMMAFYKHHVSVVFRKELDMHRGMKRDIIKTFTKHAEKGESLGRIVGNPPVIYPNPVRKAISQEIKLAYLGHDDDVEGHQGNAKDFVWFDEAVHFPRAWIDRILKHLRPADPKELAAAGLKQQALLTFNPPLTPVGLWVLDMFGPWIDKKHPLYPTPFGEILYCCYIDEQDYFFKTGEDLWEHPKTGKKLDSPLYLKSRTFFQAFITDNEDLKDNKAYIAQLQSGSEVEVRAFLHGEMSASLVDAAGQIVKRQNWLDAEARWDEKEKLHKGTPPLCISIDLTGGGDDRFVCMPFWRGGHAGMPHHVKGNELPKASHQCDFVENYIQDTFGVAADSITIVYDGGGGYGDAFRDEWQRRYEEAEMYRFKGANAAKINGIFGDPEMDKTIGEISGMPFVSGSNTFTNTISAAWIRAGQMLEHDMFELSVPHHTKLSVQAQSRLIKERAGKHLGIETKDQLRARTKSNESPDFADTWVMGLHWMSSEIAVVDQFSKR